MRKSLIIFTGLAVLLCLTSSGALAWEMTDELQAEVDAKRKALEEAPDDPHAHFDLAITYAYTNYVEEGWDELKKVNELDEDFGPVALKMYRNEVAKNPDDWKLRFRLAFALYFNEMKQEAINQMYYISQMEPKDNPKRIWAYGYMGLIYGEIDEVDKAISWVKKGLKIDSNVAALHLLLASGYYKKGNGWAAFFEGMEALRLKALGY
jgi:tetratricopeptide (TPR) repeat protein